MDGSSGPSSLSALNNESVPVETVPSKFKTTVEDIIKYDSYLDSNNKKCINKYSYIHAIINDSECTVTDLQKHLSTNQIIGLVKENQFHNEEMDSDLVISIRKEYKADLYDEELPEINSFVKTQVEYKSQTALQEYKSELAAKYEKKWN